MITDTIEDHWLEAETAIGYRTFYALHIRTLKKVTVLYGPSHHTLHEIAARYAANHQRHVRWHSIYTPERLTGVAIPDEECCYMSSKVFRSLVVPASVQVDSHTIGPEPFIDPHHEDIRMRIRRCLQAALTALHEYEALRFAAPLPQPDWVDQWTFSTP